MESRGEERGPLPREGGRKGGKDKGLGESQALGRGGKEDDSPGASGSRYLHEEIWSIGAPGRASGQKGRDRPKKEEVHFCFLFIFVETKFFLLK